MATRGTRAASLRSQPAATSTSATSNKSKANPKILVEASDTDASQESAAANVKCLSLRIRLTSMAFSLNYSNIDVFFSNVRPRRKTYETGHDARRANDLNLPVLIFTGWPPIDCLPLDLNSHSHVEPLGPRALRLLITLNYSTCYKTSRIRP